MTTIEEYLKKKPTAERLGQLQQLAWVNPSELTIWIGAGFGKHYGNLPTWSELLKLLCSRQKPSPEADLVKSLIERGRLQVAAELLTEIQSENLNETICDIFSNPICRPFENPLRKISPNTIITTNYDLILDAIYDDYRILDPKQPIENIFNSRPRLVKLHGSVADAASIVLNVTSYAKTYSKEFEWFLIHILQNSTVLFLGSGLSESEPYMKYIHLLKNRRLLKHHHFALLPFQDTGDEKRTNALIRDKSNYYETLGIRILPYVVGVPSDYQFMDEFLKALIPPSTSHVINSVCNSMEEALKVFGPEHIGPTLFRSAKIFESRLINEKPFQNIIAKFLRSIREPFARLDLVKAWHQDLNDLIARQEAYVKETCKIDIELGRSSKFEELNKNKAFFHNLKETWPN